MRCSRLAFLVLAGLLLGKAALADTPLAGGDDVLILEDSPENLQAGVLRMTSGGVLFYATTRAIAGGITPEKIEIYRSTDGGTLWELWGSIPKLSTERLRMEEFVLAEGTVKRVHVLYNVWSSGLRQTIRLATADPASATPSWSVTTPFSHGAVDFVDSDLASDVDAFGSYYLYAVAQGDDVNGNGDIWFARSTNKGVSWEAAYRICDVSGATWYMWPKISYGGGRIHVAWSFGDNCAGGLCVENAVRYFHALNFAGGPGDWQPVQVLTGLNSGIETHALDIAASAGNNEVQLLYATRSFSSDPILWRSGDGGTTWNVANKTSFPAEQFPARVQMNAAGDRLWLSGVILTASCSSRPFVIEGTGTPALLGAAKCYSLTSGSRSIEAPALAPDPTDSAEYGLVWASGINVCAGDPPKPLRFDATWFEDPGYPTVEPGYPISLPSQPVTHPAVAQLDSDPFLEIVYGSGDGNVHVLSHDGVEQPGWPRNIGPMAYGGAIAVSDLLGDGNNVIVAGNSSGRIRAFDPATGEFLPGFPLQPGSAEARVAVAAVMAPYRKSIVATVGHKTHIISYRGEVLQSWVFSNEFSTAPAVGDVDNDDQPDIFVVQGDDLIRLQPGNPDPVWTQDVTLFAISAPPTLVDLDLDGDREIVIGTVTGLVKAYDHNGGLIWSYSAGSDVVSAIAAGNFLGGLQPELAASSGNDIHMLLWSGVSQAGYPQTTSIAGGGQLTAPILDRVHWSSSDIVAASNLGDAWAWVNLGGKTPGWPKPVGDPVGLTPASGDIDNDGSNELVILTDTGMTILDVNHAPGTASENRWPMWGNDAGRSFCSGCESEPLVTAAPEAATRFAFAPPSPNPSSGQSIFQFALPERGGVEIVVFDVRGRKVRQVMRQQMDEGQHTIGFDGRDDRGMELANGQYLALLRVRAGGHEWQQTRKLSLVR